MSSVLLHNNLKQIRLSRGLTQKQLAYIVGCSRNTISNLEIGIFTPTMLLAAKISVALDIMVDQIFILDRDISNSILDRYVDVHIQNIFLRG